MSARFGSLTFAKRWLVCRAKGNVPNVGRLSTFLSCGWAKKLNLFSVIVISFFHSQTIISVIFGVSVFFFALLLTSGAFRRQDLYRPICARAPFFQIYGFIFNNDIPADGRPMLEACGRKTWNRDGRLPNYCVSDPLSPGGHL